MSQSVYIFDVDGVINDIHTYKADNRVLTQINKLLDNGCYVAINTGRGYAWVEEDVISYLRKKSNSIGNLNRMFVSAEMGGLTVEFVNGTEHHNKTVFSLLPEQINRAKKLYEENKVGGITHWYSGKLSMATIDKPAGVTPKDFLEKCKSLTNVLNKEFENEHVKVKHNPDAIDITTPEAGKWAGAQLIYDWLQRTPVSEYNHFICFGDNASDYEMARFFGKKSNSVDFVFTGESLGEIEHDSNIDFIKTSSLYNKGTYEFLRNHLQSEMKLK